MGLSHSYGPAAEKQDGDPADPRRIRAWHHLLRHRRGLWPVHEREVVGEALQPIRDQVVIATKFGFDIEGTGQQRAWTAGRSISAKWPKPR